MRNSFLSFASIKGLFCVIFASSSKKEKRDLSLSCKLSSITTMGKKNKLNLDHKFTLFIKLSRRIPNAVNISKIHDFYKYMTFCKQSLFFVLDDSVREMFPSVSNVRKPRQKSSRWLLVDFENNDQAEEFKKMLAERKEIAKIKVKVNKLIIKQNDPSNLPENERQQYVNSLTKQSFQSKSLEKYSNKLLVTNLSESVTSSELAELFPHHISIDLKKSPKVRAIISYSSVKEAIDARMKVRPQLNDGQKIRVILLLLGDEARKRTTMGDEKDVGGKKKSKKEPHKFTRPLRYFENAEIE
jgi:hypothetical protein